MHDQVEAAEALERDEVDAVDQAPEGGSHLVGVGRVQNLADRFRHLPIGLGRGRVQGDDRGGLAGAGQQGGDLGAPGLQRLGRPLQVLDLHRPGQIGLGGALDAPFDLGRLALERGALLAGVALGRLLFRLEGAHGLRDHVRGQQVTTHARDDPRLDRLGLDGLGVDAHAAILVVGAAIDPALKAHRPRAELAGQQAGQQTLRLPGVDPRLVGDGGLPLAHRVPRRVVDDAEIRNGLAHPLIGRVEHAGSPAGLRMLAIAPPVEHPHADVKLLAQYAVLGPAVAGDGGRGPGSAARAGHALGVERLGDARRAFAPGVVVEDPAHDRGLGLVDGQDAAITDGVAVASAAGGEAGAHPRLEAAPGLLAELDQEQAVHRALEADVQFGDRAAGLGFQADAGEAEKLEQARGVGLAARQPIQGLDIDHVEGAGRRRAHQGLDARSGGDGRTGHAVIRELAGDDLAARGREAPQAVKLILGRALVLQVGAVAGV